MSDPSNEFAGFPKEGLDFLRDLKNNNNKAWFKQNKIYFENKLQNPARLFVQTMGETIIKSFPKVHFDPKFNGSIFRIYRDTRFSKDKIPFKTHLGILFWEGLNPKMECPGFYFHLEPPNLTLGGGMYMFSKTQLETWRNQIIKPKIALEFRKVIGDLEQRKITVGGKHYKRVPRGFDKQDPNVDLLLYNGLYCMKEISIPQQLYSKDIVDFCMLEYNKMSGLHHLLVKHIL